MAIIRLQIDRLTLNGFDLRHRYRIGDAFERELNRLLAERGLPPNLDPSESHVHVPLSRIEIAPGLRPEAAGAAIAQELYAQLMNRSEQWSRNGSDIP
jgi:hypothetical protein